MHTFARNSYCFLGLLSLLFFASILNASQEVLPCLPGPTYRLGQGYDSKEGKFREQCVFGTPVLLNDLSSQLNLDQGMDRTQIFRLLAGEVGGGVGLGGLLSASAAVRVASVLNQSEYNHSVFYTSGAKRTAFLSQIHLTEKGQEAVASLDPEYIRLVCGDSFVEKITLGSRLVLEARVDLFDKKLRNEIKTTIKVKIAFKTFKKTIRKIKEYTNARSQISFTGFQIGGDQKAFQNLMQESEAFTCQLNDLQQCEQIVEKFISYATSQQQNYPGLLDYAPDSLAYSPLSYHLSGYESHNLGLRGSLQRMNSLSKRYLLKIIQLKAQSLSLIDLAFKKINTESIKPRQRDALENLEKKLIHHKWFLQSQEKACSAFPKKCQKLYQQAERMHGFIDLKPLHAKVSFIEICQKNKANFSQNGLLAWLHYQYSSTDCRVLEQKVQGTRALKIRNHSLQDISLLKTFEHLQTLDLSFNSISDISALQDKPLIKKLILKGNPILSLAPLESMNHLESLDVSFTNIESLKPIAALPKLKHIVSFENLVSDYRSIKESRPKIKLTENLDRHCHQLRKNALQSGSIDSYSFDLYTDANWGPLYEDPYAHKLQIVGWIHCYAAGRLFELIP